MILSFTFNISTAFRVIKVSNLHEIIPYYMDTNIIGLPVVLVLVLLFNVTNCVNLLAEEIHGINLNELTCVDQCLNSVITTILLE